jgi:hypothetical protein
MEIITMSGNQHRFIYNCDANNTFIYDYPLSADRLAQYVDEVAAPGCVTTFFMSCHVGMDMNYAGEQADLAGSHMTSEQRDTLYDPETCKLGTSALGLKSVHELVEDGHDPLGIHLSRSAELGMETFITWRLNEVHCVEQPDSWLLSRFWKEHPEWRVGNPGDPLPEVYKDILGPVSPVVETWIAGGLDFSVPEVRAQTIDQITEVCERYPIDGIDLDFQRFPIYFKFGEGPQNTPIMTEFIREIRGVTNAAGEKRGRPLQLTARIMAKPEHNTGLGLDPVTWASEGLLDFVTVAHYLKNAFPLPVSEYKALFPADLPMYACIEYEREPDRYREIARQLWSEGADGLMVYNFFAAREGGNEPPFFVLPELADRDRMLKGEDS